MPGTLVVSLDFELFWGLTDCMKLSEYEANVLGGRRAVPQLLELFRKHGIHATWDTVGFQFAESYDELKPFLPPKELQPSYEKVGISNYDVLASSVGDEQSQPCFYGASLVRQVAQAPDQEIGCHTFCHYYCREPGQNTEQFAEDLRSALSFAESKGYRLTSLVFPRNETTPEHIAIARSLGFTAFRDEEHDWIHKVRPFQLLRFFRLWDAYFPITGYGGSIPKNEGGLVNIPGTRVYRAWFKPLSFMEGLKVHRIKMQMRHAAKHGLTYHLWWHPHNVGVKTELHMQQLEEIFSYYDTLREKYGMRSRNMREIAAEVLGKEKT